MGNYNRWRDSIEISTNIRALINRMRGKVYTEYLGSISLGNKSYSSLKPLRYDVAQIKKNLANYVRTMETQDLKDKLNQWIKQKKKREKFDETAGTFANNMDELISDYYFKIDYTVFGKPKIEQTLGNIQNRDSFFTGQIKFNNSLSDSIRNYLKYWRADSEAQFMLDQFIRRLILRKKFNKLQSEIENQLRFEEYIRRLRDR